MENGNVLSYTIKNPEANRLRLVSLVDRWINVEFDDRCPQLIDVASGLKFLHRMSLVHGNIRGVSLTAMVVNGGPFLKAPPVKHPNQRRPAPTSPSRGLRPEHDRTRCFLVDRGIHRLDCTRTVDSR